MPILKNALFVFDEFDFLGFVANFRGVEVDASKIDAIKNWSTPQFIGDVRSYHGLTSFYRRFVKWFSTIANPRLR